MPIVVFLHLPSCCLLFLFIYIIIRIILLLIFFLFSLLFALCIISMSKYGFERRSGSLRQSSVNPATTVLHLLIELSQQFLLSLRYLLGNLDLQVHNVISLSSLRMKVRNSLAAEHELRIDLSALRNLHLHNARECSHVDGPSQDGLRQTNWAFGMNVHTIAMEVLVLVHQDLDDQISTGSARIALGALLRKPQVHSVVNARRNIHGNVPFLHLHSILFLIVYLISKMQILLHPGHRLLEGETDVHLKIGAPSRTAFAPALSSAEEGLEQLLGIDLLVGGAEVEGAVSSRKAAEASESFEWVAAAGTSEAGIWIDSGVAVGIVHLALFFIR
mmetsp:Transcript_20865/g.35860  ORF Transcript_20865/g.35860 Transcript_20865/m.35860 type:complete len:331 (+) Transcript_20865:128-1120(+)